MFNSAEYWENRYRVGKNSGAGSYGRLATFKATVINEMISKNKIESIIDFGCGDGNQLSLMQPRKYIGVDVSPSTIQSLRDRFESQPLFSFVLADGIGRETRYDLSMSIDVIYHLIEDSVFESYMENLFFYADRFVLIYSSNTVLPYAGSHIRHRRFSDFVESKFPGWRQVGHIANPYPWDKAQKDNTSFADFFIYAPFAMTQVDVPTAR